MSKSPHRLRGDAAECWKALLFGEIVRAVGRPVTVRADATVKLPRSGHWESGLAKLRPALDDALGATALAVAWRWACAEKDAYAWPSLALLAAKATDAPVTTSDGLDVLARFGPDDRGFVNDGPGERTWSIRLGDRRVDVSVTGVDADFAQVDRVAAIAAAWLEVLAPAFDRGSSDR